jgi:hypothetical protein
VRGAAAVSAWIPVRVTAAGDDAEAVAVAVAVRALYWAAVVRGLPMPRNQLSQTSAAAVAAVGWVRASVRQRNTLVWSCCCSGAAVLVAVAATSAVLRVWCAPPLARAGNPSWHPHTRQNSCATLAET